MAQTMVYTCDICKQSDCVNNLARITVTTGERGVTIADCDNINPLKIDICADCLKKKGFSVKFGESLEYLEKRQNTKILEEKLFEILKDVGVAFMKGE